MQVDCNASTIPRIVDGAGGLALSEHKPDNREKE